MEENPNLTDDPREPNSEQNENLDLHQNVYSIEHPRKRSIGVASFSIRNKLVKHRKWEQEGRQFKCDLCDQEFEKATELVDHKTDHRVGEFGSSFCSVVFPGQSNLNKDRLIIEGESTGIHGSLCAKDTNDGNLQDDPSKKLNSHQRDHTVEEFNKKFCSVVFPGQNNLINDRLHSKGVPSHSGLCDKELKDRDIQNDESDGLFDEKKSKSSPKNASFTSEGQPNEHGIQNSGVPLKANLQDEEIKHFNEEENELTFEKEIKRFVESDLPSKEMKSLQREENLFPTNLHNNEVKNRSLSLDEENEKSSVGDINFSINNAPNTIRDQFAILERLQSLDKMYRCDMCDKSFKQKGHFIVHQRVHTGEKPFKCQECGKGFTKKNNLNVHIQSVHGGEKRFICSYCKKSFAQKCHLTIHERVHSGEKPFECPTCSKGFAKKSSLTTHVRIHTGEKPFKCDKCKKRFASKSNFTQHVKQLTCEKQPQKVTKL